MKLFLVKSLEVLSWLGFVAVIALGAAAGARRAWLWDASPALGGLAGGLVGLLVAMVVFGVLFLVMDIADNTRRTRELLERRDLDHLRG